VISLHVGGLGLCAPAAAGAIALPSDPRRAAAPPPLPAALKRRASGLTLLACEALGQAAADAGVALATVPLLLGSAYGEIGTAVEMMRSFAEPTGLPSPVRFHNSVHNTPISYASIAFGNGGFSTALAAGPDTVAMALVEAAALLAERGGDALLVFADEPVPAPFAPQRSWVAAAAAIHLSAAPSAASRARISLPRRGGAAPTVPACLAAHPCAGAFALVDAISRGSFGALSLGPEGEGWTVDIEAVRP
jgi:hypothetical protein